MAAHIAHYLLRLKDEDIKTNMMPSWINIGLLKFQARKIKDRESENPWKNPGSGCAPHKH
jgi:hypothetical protein